MPQKLPAILLSICALLCGDCMANTVRGISEVNQFVSDRQVFAESHEIHRHTRKDLSGYRDMETDSNNISVWNCSRLYDSSYGYNESSCRFVRENCQTKAHLINYLTFMKCDLPTNVKVSNSHITQYVAPYIVHTYIACRLHTTNHMVLLSHLSPCHNGKFQCIFQMMLAQYAPP